MLTHERRSKASSSRSTPTRATLTALSMMVIRLKKRSPAQPSQALPRRRLRGHVRQLLIAADEHVDPYDLDAVIWVCSTRIQPHLEVTIIRNGASMLNLSAADPEEPREQQFFGKPPGASAMLIDATRNRTLASSRTTSIRVSQCMTRPAPRRVLLTEARQASHTLASSAARSRGSSSG